MEGKHNMQEYAEAIDPPNQQAFLLGAIIHITEFKKFHTNKVHAQITEF